MLRRLHLWLVTGAVVLVALAAAACGRDAGAPGVATGPEARALVEGARIEALVQDRVEVPAGAAVAPATSAWRQAVVLGGEAREAETGALLAVLPGTSGRDGERRGEEEQVDREGHRHRLLVDGGGKGPVTRVRYERDGEEIAEVAFRWDARAGGWMLRERTLTLKRGGRVIARLVRSVRVAQVSEGEASAAPVGAPPFSRADVFGCFREWARYLGASTALIIAGEAYVLQPQNPAIMTALLGAVGVWEQSLDALLECQWRSAIGL